MTAETRWRGFVLADHEPRTVLPSQAMASGMPCSAIHSSKIRSTARVLLGVYGCVSLPQLNECLYKQGPLHSEKGHVYKRDTTFLGENTEFLANILTNPKLSFITYIV